MAFANSQNLAAANRLCQRLRDQGYSLTINDPQIESDGSITISVGAGTAGAAGFLVQFSPDPLIQQDSLGNASRPYAPSLLKIGFEAHASIAGFPIPADTLALTSVPVAIANLFGYEVDLFLTPNAAFPVVAQLIDANLIARIRPDPRFGMISQN